MATKQYVFTNNMPTAPSAVTVTDAVTISPTLYYRPTDSVALGELDAQVIGGVLRLPLYSAREQYVTLKSGESFTIVTEDAPAIAFYNGVANALKHNKLVTVAVTDVTPEDGDS